MKFLGTLPANVLDREQAIRACEKFNGLEPGTLVHFGEDSSEILHPFRDLYFVGLLGVLQREAETGNVIQRFRRPHDPLLLATAELPDSAVLLIHPALDTFTRRQLSWASFIQFQHIRIGDGLVWQPYFRMLMEIERQLHKCEADQFVEVAHQVVKRIQALLNSGTVPFARMEIETSDEWKTLNDQARNETHYDALLWLEELLSQLG